MGDDNKMFHKGKGLDELVTKFKANSGVTEAFVGFLRSSGVHKGDGKELLTVAAVAHMNEYGVEARHIPERAFFRSALAGSRKKLKKMLVKLSKNVLFNGMSEKKALTIAAYFLQTEIRKSIDSNVPPPNAPSTVARKGSDHTLIDTHQMHDSVDFEVKKGK